MAYVIGESVVISATKKMGTVAERKETDSGVQYRITTNEGDQWVGPLGIKKYLTEVPTDEDSLPMGDDSWGRETFLMEQKNAAKD